MSILPMPDEFNTMVEAVRGYGQTKTGFAILFTATAISPAICEELLYPYMRGHTPDNLPQDWFSQVAELAPSKPFAIAEAGYPSEDVIGRLIRRQNVRVRSSTQWQARYTHFILKETNRLNGKFVVWFFFHDYDDFLDQFEGEELRKVQFLRWWRDNGMVDGDGNPREALGIWDEWLKLPHRDLPRL